MGHLLGSEHGADDRLLVPQRHHGVDLRGLAGGKVACQACGGHQSQGHAGEGEQVHEIAVDSAEEQTDVLKAHQEILKARVLEAVGEFEQRVAEGKVPRVRKKGLSAEASVRAEQAKNAAVIKEAQGIDKTVANLREEITE